jgi:hypothetical protein
MKWSVMVALMALLSSAFAAGGPTSGESFQYSINWPSGLELGEGRMKAVKNGSDWDLQFEFQASIPGFSISDKFVSLTSQQQCSVRFDKDLQHGRRKTQETISFDSSKNTAQRETKDGGKSTMQIPACAKDALAFLFHVRYELAQGRIPPAQNVYYGGPYRVRLEYKGGQKLRLGDAFQDTDRVIASIKGPASDISVEVFFAKDEARTPVLVKVPLKAGTFSMEIVK